jgi:mannose-6-phosphate isomerase-like protein (cupin superfamily)
MRTQAKHIDKEWGYEKWLANNKENNYCGKILHVNAGHGFSMHLHADKHETFYILSGSAKLEIINTKTTEISTIELNEGDCYVIDRLVPHRIEAITELDIIESSTYHRDEDSYRVWRK